MDSWGTRRHLGYALVKSADLPLDLDLDIVATTPTGGVNGFTDDPLVPGVTPVKLEAQVVWQDFSLGKGSGDTPLHEAVDYNQQNPPAAVAALLAAGADVNARNRSGLTPLHLAASSNENPAVIGLLLEAGANLEARDDDGDTPLRRSSTPSSQRTTRR